MLSRSRRHAPYHGVLAQMGERFVRNEEATGSSPVSSTTYRQAHGMDKSPSTTLKRGLPRGYVGNLLTTEHPARSARVPPAAVVQWSVHLLAKQEIRVRFPPVAPKGIESRLRDPLCEARAMGRPADGAIRPAGLLFFSFHIPARRGQTTGRDDGEMRKTFPARGLAAPESCEEEDEKRKEGALK